MNTYLLDKDERMKTSSLCWLSLLLILLCGCGAPKTFSRLGAPPQLAALEGLPICGSNLQPRSWSVSVGVDRYLDERIPTLSGAAHDAWVMHHFFASPEGGGVPAERRMILLNHQATRAHIEFALGRFLARACPQDTIYVYFAGHGAPEPGRPDDAFLFMHDTRLDNLVGTSLSMRQLPQFLKWRAGEVGKLVLLLDACHSGSINFPNQRGVVIDTEVKLSATLDTPSSAQPSSDSRAKALKTLSKQRENERADAIFKQLKGLNKAEPQWSVLTASSSSQVAGERSDALQCPYTAAGYQGGLFTCALLEGLRGGADPDRDRDLKLSELHSFVEARVSKLSEGAQTPQWLGSDLKIPLLQRPLTIPRIPPELLAPPKREASALTWTGVWGTAAATTATLVFSALTLRAWNQTQIYHNDGRVTVSAERYQSAEADYVNSLTPLNWSALSTGVLLLGTTASYLVDRHQAPSAPERDWFTIHPRR